MGFENEKNKYHVPALEKGFIVLEHLAQKGKGSTMSQLCDELRLSRNTSCHSPATIDTPPEP